MSQAVQGFSENTKDRHELGMSQAVKYGWGEKWYYVKCMISNSPIINETNKIKFPDLTFKTSSNCRY